MKKANYFNAYQYDFDPGNLRCESRETIAERIRTMRRDCTAARIASVIFFAMAANMMRVTSVLAVPEFIGRVLTIGLFSLSFTAFHEASFIADGASDNQYVLDNYDILDENRGR